MMYLKPILERISRETSSPKEIHKELMQMKNDQEAMEFLEGKVQEEKIGEHFYSYYGVKYSSLSEIDRDIVNQFELDFLLENNFIPLRYDSNSNTYLFAISDLSNRSLRDRIRRMISSQKSNAEFLFAFEYKINEALKEKEEVKREVSDSGDFSATEWVNRIIDKGIELNASDIHIERLKESIQVRYRVDGSLINKREYNFTDSEISNVYVRLKIVSNMDIVESRKSQDGRIDNYSYKDRFYDLRVNTVNTIFGEKVVMRIINKSGEVASFDELGFTEENKKKVKEMLSAKNGIIYLAGATGSGKTTTLYTMIDHLNNDDVNIYTIEDPVEKTIDNVNQIQIDEASGTDYPSVLAALLRQDPNIIVVGEVRDVETAGLSIRASLTGHLVITTLHANNALDSLSRLSDMGMEDYLVGASSVGFLSQVLLRKLCPECKVRKENIEVYEEEWLKSHIPDFDYEEEKAKGNYFYDSTGCSSCSSGTKGRIASLELILVDEKLRSMISRGDSMSDIKAELEKNGYKTMVQDGIIKAKKGIISVIELMSQF